MPELSPIRVAGRRAGDIVPAILCGGSGSRLWPVSRRDFGKEHAVFMGGASPLQQTISLLVAGTFADPIVVSAAASHFLVADQAREAGSRIEAVLEPVARDTLAAVAAAACVAERRDPGATLLVLPSDHLIPDATAFAAAAE